MALELQSRGGRPSQNALRRLLEAFLAALRRSADQSPVTQLLLVAVGAAGPALALVVLRQLWRALQQRLALPASAEDNESCCFCNTHFKDQAAQRNSGPIFRLPTNRKLPKQLAGKRCFLGCVMRGSGPEASPLPKDIAEELWAFQADSPELWKRNDATVRICMEDLRLQRVSEICKPSRAPSPMAWLFAGVREVRISSCALQTIPKEIGLMKSLKALVILSCELGSLPAELGELSSLEQLFLNGNYLKALPRALGTYQCCRRCVSMPTRSQCFRASTARVSRC